MIKEALQYIVSLNKTETLEVKGNVYSDKPLHKVEIEPVEVLTVANLSSIVNYIKKNPDGCHVKAAWPYIIHIGSESVVSLCTPTVEDNFMIRDTQLRAKAITGSMRFGNKYDRESFNIALQSQFVRTDNIELLLKIISNLVEENGVQVSDDGISQKVTAKTGIARVENVDAPNPITLAPFRTFIEVEQPESLFVFRIHEGFASSLHEADGGLWKYKAIKNIEQYFRENLAEEFEKGTVTILA